MKLSKAAGSSPFHTFSLLDDGFVLYLFSVLAISQCGVFNMFPAAKVELGYRKEMENIGGSGLGNSSNSFHDFQMSGLFRRLKLKPSYL